MSLDVYLKVTKPTEVYSDNITHNLNKMAQEAGLYEVLWRPEENDLLYAAQLIPLLEKGLLELRKNATHYSTFNPTNGWGNYEILLDFVEDYLDACRANPDATVEVCR